MGERNLTEARRRIAAYQEGAVLNLFSLGLTTPDLTQLMPELLACHLTALDLNYNALKTLPDSFGQLIALRRLSVHMNFLEKLPDSFGQLGALEELWLIGNILDQLSDSFGGLVNLKQLRPRPQSAEDIA